MLYSVLCVAMCLLWFYTLLLLLQLLLFWLYTLLLFLPLCLLWFYTLCLFCFYFCFGFIHCVCVCLCFCFIDCSTATDQGFIAPPDCSQPRTRDLSHRQIAQLPRTRDLSHHQIALSHGPGIYIHIYKKGSDKVSKQIYRFILAQVKIHTARIPQRTLSGASPEPHSRN